MKTENRENRQKAGFTMIELLVVLVILMIIGTMAVQSFLKEPDKASVKTTRVSFTQIENSLERFKLDCGRYPTADEGIEALMFAPAGLESDWGGEYLTKERHMRDAWDNEYLYSIPGPNNKPYEVISYGADGVEGGEKYSADLSNLD